MSRTRKTLVIITGTILLLIVLFFIVLATFDWNRLKPTINQKVSAELNRPFAIRGDLGVVWERQPCQRLLFRPIEIRDLTQLWRR